MVRENAVLNGKYQKIVQKSLKWDGSNPELSLALPSCYFLEKEIVK